MRRRWGELKTAIVYDRVNKWGGAERVLLVLHEMFPEAPLFTSVYNPKTAAWAEVFSKVSPSFLNKIALLRTKHEWLAALMPLAFEAHDFSEYDLVISVTSEAGKGIVTKPETKHVCYCLTPTRYLWSGYGEYFNSLIKRSITKPVISYLKWWDKMAAQRPDVMIAISTEVQKRIKKYYRRDSQIIYPPLCLHRENSLFRSPRQGGAGRSFFEESDRDYYLVVSRLVKYKRVELVIEAFNEMGKKLMIVGAGKEEKKLKGIGGRKIKFMKGLTDVELAKYYENCRALLVAQREDFGLVMVEVMAMGKPVIAFRGGGALDIVKEGINGIFFDKQNKESIIEAIRRFEKMRFGSGDIKRSVKKFSEEKFKKKLLKIIKER